MPLNFSWPIKTMDFNLLSYFWICPSKKTLKLIAYKLDLIKKTKVGYFVIKDFGDTTTVGLED